MLQQPPLDLIFMQPSEDLMLQQPPLEWMLQHPSLDLMLQQASPVVSEGLYGPLCVDDLEERGEGAALIEGIGDGCR